MTETDAIDRVLARFLVAHPEKRPSTTTVLEMLEWWSTQPQPPPTTRVETTTIRIRGHHESDCGCTECVCPCHVTWADHEEDFCPCHDCDCECHGGR